jgi:transcriptional regulator with XRE-family HTH domain
MDPASEKQAFSNRLKAALKRAPKSIQTASDLAHHFNLRYSGESITIQSAHKWLTGKAKPSADKLETLAAWLGVSAHWLAYGPPPAKKLATLKRGASGERAGTLTEQEAKLLSRLRTLSEHQAELVVGLVEQLALERELAGHS